MLWRNGFRSLDASFKQTHGYATQGLFHLGHSVARVGRDSLKECDKQKYGAMRNLHYLKDIALDAFEIFNAGLKNDGKDGNWFVSLPLISFKMS